MTLYDRIGTTYDSTRRADPYIVGRLLHHLRPRPDATYLDLGCGTANYTSALAAAGVRIVGVEPSSTMRAKAQAKVPDLRLCAALAEALPMRSASIAGGLAT